MAAQTTAATPIRAENQPQFKLINSNHHVQTLENGSLAIRQSSKEHEGIYLCEADNGVEPNLVKSLRLLVHLQAQFTDEIQLLESSALLSNSIGAQVSGSIGSQSSVNGGQSMLKVARVVQNSNLTRLVCQPFGDLPITLDWFKDGQLIYSHTWTHSASAGSEHELDLSPRMSIETFESRVGGSSPATSQQQSLGVRQSGANVAFLETQLSIVGVRRSDGGLFSCLARNSFGQAERKLRLLVQEPPEPPEVVDVAHISSRSISLRWLAPNDGNSPIVKYTLEYKKQSGKHSPPAPLIP